MSVWALQKISPGKISAESSAAQPSFMRATRCQMYLSAWIHAVRPPFSNRQPSRPREPHTNSLVCLQTPRQLTQALALPCVLS